MLQRPSQDNVVINLVGNVSETTGGSNSQRSSISYGSDRSSITLHSNSGDPTVASVGVRHSSPAGFVVIPSSLVNNNNNQQQQQQLQHRQQQSLTKSATISENQLSMANALANGSNNSNNNGYSTNNSGGGSCSLSLSSGTGTTSPLSSSSPRLSTCSSTLALNNEPTSQCTTADRILRELIETETSYVRDLEDVIIGYIVPLRIEKILPEADLECIFSNIEEIYYLNKRLSMRLHKAVDRSTGLPSLAIISRCFSDKSNCEKLISVYRRYCSSFAGASSRLEAIQHSHNYANVTRHIRELQISLGHTLPLFAYLLKPVQRILKYQLLWQKLADQFHTSAPEHAMAFDAALSMVHIAQIINSCVSLQSTSVENSANTTKASTWRPAQQQQQQPAAPLMTSSVCLPSFNSSSNVLRNVGSSSSQIPAQMVSSTVFTRPASTSSFSASGQPSFVRVIVMQGQLQMRGAKHPRHVVLFDTSLVVYKVHRLWRKSQEQEQLVHQITIPASSLKLCEVPDKGLSVNNASSFTVEALTEPKSSNVFQAESVDKKQAWCEAIRNVILKAATAASKLATDADAKRHTISMAQLSKPVLAFQQQQHLRRSASPFLVGDEQLKPNIGCKPGVQSTAVSSSVCSEASRNLDFATSAKGNDQQFEFTSAATAGKLTHRSASGAFDTNCETGTLSDLEKAINNRQSKQNKSCAMQSANQTDDNIELRHAINRTDSEKWRERNRWIVKAATLDRHSSGQRSEKRPTIDCLNYSTLSTTALKATSSGDKQNQRLLVPKQHCASKRAFLRRPSFICETYLLRVSQQRQEVVETIPVTTADNDFNKMANQQTPVRSFADRLLATPENQRRFSRSNGIRRFFDAVAKRFRSSDRVNKSFAFAESEPVNPPLFGDLSNSSAVLPSFTSTAAVTTVPASSVLAAHPSALAETCVIREGFQSPLAHNDKRPSTAELFKMNASGKTVDRAMGLHRLSQSMAKQSSCSAILYTPRQPVNTQQRQLPERFGAFKKKPDARTKYTHWATSGVPRDVFV